MADGKGTFRFQLAALALGLIVSILMVEIVPRLAPGLMPKKVQSVLRLYEARNSNEGMMRGDRRMGFVLQPGIDIDFPSEGFKIPIQTVDSGVDNIGRRDIGTEEPYEALAFGDSFTFCDDSTPENCWVRKLSEQTGMSTATFGMNGYSNLAAARLLETVGPTYKPKVVLATFFANDFKDNLHFDNWTKSGTDHYWTWMRRKRRSDSSETLARWSILYRLGDAARRYGKRRVFEHREGGLDFVFRADGWWRTVLDLPGQTPGYFLTEKAFSEMKKTSDDLGAELVVLLFPFKEQVYWDIARQYQREGDDFSEEQVDAPMRAVRDYLASQGIRYCDLTPGLRAAGRDGRQVYLRISAHWTADGNAEAAKIVAECLREQGLVNVPAGG